MTKTVKISKPKTMEGRNKIQLCIGGNEAAESLSMASSCFNLVQMMCGDAKNVDNDLCEIFSSLWPRKYDKIAPDLVHGERILKEIHVKIFASDALAFLITGKLPKLISVELVKLLKWSQRQT